MAHVHIIDSGLPINCPYGRVAAPETTQKWTPKVYRCVTEAELPDYTDRFLGGESDADIIVDGC